MDNFRRDFVLFIKKIEDNYDVNSYLVNDIRVWPLLRNILFEIVSRHREYTLKEKIYEKFINYKLKKIKKKQSEESDVFTYDSKLEILFISDDHFYVEYNSKYSNKYLDPIFEDLSKKFKSRKLHLSSQISNKKNITSYQIKTRPNSEEIKIEIDILDFLNQLKEDIQNTKYKNINFENIDYILKRKLEDINEGRNFIEDMKVKPKFIFYSSYAHPFKIGINIASKLHKIKTIDVQHGIQGKNNPDYTNWTKVPNNKYEMLPDWFWTWNEISKERIENLDNNSLSGLNATVSGYKFLERYDKSKIQQFDVLITLQPLFFNQPTYLQYFVLKLIKDYKNISWVIKPHPKHTDRDLIKIEKIFSFKNVYITKQKNIFELFKQCKLHITEFSSTAYEGLYFNVPTVFTNLIAAEEFPDEIKNKLFYISTDYEDFKKKVFELLNKNIEENLFDNTDRNYIDLFPISQK